MVSSMVVCLFGPAYSAAHVKLDYSRVGYRTFDVFAGGDRSRWRIGESYTEAQMSTETFGVRWSLNFAQSFPDGDLRWGSYASSNSLASTTGGSDNGKLSGRVFFQDSYFQTVVSAELLDRGGSTSLGWRRKSGDRHEISARLRVQPFGFLKAAIKRSREYTLPSYSELFYEYTDSEGALEREGGRLHWRAPSWVTEVRFHTTPANHLVLESAIREVDWKPDEPEPGESSPGTYVGVPDGFLSDGRIRAVYVTRGGWSVTVEFRRIRLDTRLRAYDGGRLFAHFGIVKANGRQWSLGAEHDDWFLRLHTGEAEGEIKGVVEAWPFAKGLLRFLGERRHFVGEGDVNWKYATVGRSLWNNRKVRVNASFDYLRILPDLKYATWRPVLFGFGVDDLKSERLELVRADLVRVRLKPTMRWRCWQLELDIAQWLPLSTKKAGREHPGEPTAGQIEPSSSETSEYSWGGFSAAVSLGARF